jgi:hypothetical protein
MIVRPVPGGSKKGQKGLQLITQPDHAHLARRIMARCVALASHPRREAILLAVGEHDAAWDEVDAAPAIDAASGAVVDFVKAPLSVRQGVWPRSTARLEREPWAAALVAHHAWTVYARFRPDPDWASFFPAMAATRDAMVRMSGLTLPELEADYPYLRLGDLISLTFCTGSTDEQRFGDWTIQLSGARVVVTPDPFGGAIVPIEVDAREVHGGPFRSDAEWQAAWSAASPTALRGEVAGSLPP